MSAAAPVPAPYAPPPPTFEQRARAACETLASRPWIALGVLAAIRFAAYVNAVPNAFVFDDNDTLRVNTLVRHPERITELFWGGSTARAYRPIRYLSFMIDYAIAGDTPWIFHLFNTLYHTIVCWLVLRLVHRLTGDARAAVAASLLFALHPAHTECVAYISGRRDLLTTLFYLTGFLAFLRWREAKGLALGWVAAIGASLFLALGSKEMAVTFPAMIILYELYFDRRALLRHTPIYALGAAAAAFVVWRTVMGNISGQRGPWGDSWFVHGMTAVCLVANYARLTVFPATLVADYSAESFPLARSLGEPRTIVALLVLLGCASAVVALALRRPRISFGIAWFFLALAPVSQIVPYHELGADHYVYLPSVGLLLLAGIGFAWLWDRAGAQTAAAALGAVLVALLVRTEVRILDWRTAESIYEATLRTAPRCARARMNLGAIVASRESPSAAEREKNRRAALVLYDQAIAIQPDYLFARCGRAKILQLVGEHEQSIAEYERALEIARRQDPPAIPVETILMHLSRWEEAKQLLLKNLADRRRGRDALLLGRCQEMLGEHNAALASYTLASTARVFGEQGHFAAAREAQRIGDMKAAQEHLKALEADVGPERVKQLFHEQAQRRAGREGAQPPPRDLTVSATGTAGPVIELGKGRPPIRIVPGAPAPGPAPSLPPSVRGDPGDDGDVDGLLDESAPPKQDRPK